MALSISKQYLNPYEKLYDIARTTNAFTNEGWEYAAKEGTLDEYITALDITKNIDMSKFYSDYNLNYANASTNASALYNEAFADKTVKKKTIDKYNEYGDIIGTEDIEISDYEYNKQIIKEQNDALKQNYFDQVAREYKDEQHWLLKTVGHVGSVGTSLVRGVFAGVNDIVEFLGGFIEGTVNSISNNTDWAQSIGEVMASDKYRLFQFIEDATVEFEKNYGYRDVVTGEYTTAGAIIGGAFESIGKMLPSAALAYVTGGGSVVAMGTFYLTSEFGQGYEQNYITAKRLSEQGQLSDPNYLEIMGLQALTTGAKAAISIALTKAMGGTYAKEKLLGLPNNTRIIGEGTNTIVKYLLTLGGDALEEGLEEVLQDATEALIFDTFYGGDYAQLSDLSASDLAITFASAALGGIIGTGVGTLLTERRTVEENGETVKLGKIKSFLLNSDLNTIFNEFNTAKTLANKIRVADVDYENNRTYLKYQKTATRAYKSLRIISSMFGQIGETRANNIEKALTRISQAAEAGMYDRDFVNDKLDEIIKQISTMPKAFKIHSIKKLKDDLEQAGITKLAIDIASGEATVDISDDMRDKLQAIKQPIKSKDVIMAADGKDIVVTDDNSTVIIPSSKLASEKAIDIIKQIAHKKCKNVISQLPSFSKAIQLLKKVYTKIYNSKYTDDIALSAFFSNTDFVIECLIADSKLTQQFIVEINALINSEVSKISTDSKEIQFAKNYVATAQVKWKNAIEEYLEIKPDANTDIVETVIEEKVITNPRRIFYRHFIDNKLQNLSTNERALLQSVLDKAKTFDARILISTVDEISSIEQFNIIYKAYEASINHADNYLPNITAANRAFNRWLKYKQLDLSTVWSSNLSDIEQQLMRELQFTSVKELRQYQFETDTNMMFTFDIITYTDGQFSISTSYYNTVQQLENMYIDENTIERMSLQDIAAAVNDVTRSNDMMPDQYGIIATDTVDDFVKSLLRDDVDMSSNYTITDIIRNPYLAKDFVVDILVEDGAITSSNIGVVVDERAVFLQLSYLLIDKSKGTKSIVQLKDGTYAIANIVPYSKLINRSKVLRKLKALGTLQHNQEIDLRDCIQPAFRDANIKFKYDANAKNPYTKSEQNTIYLTKAVFSEEQIFAVIGHEVCHILQALNNQSRGASSTLMQRLLKSGRKNEMRVFNDALDIMSEYIPDIYKLSPAMQAKLMDDILYNLSSGELNAYGITNADVNISFIPLLMTDDTIVFPNGRILHISNRPYLFHENISTTFGEEKVITDTPLDLLENESYNQTLKLYYHLLDTTNFQSPGDEYLNEYIYKNEAYTEQYDKALAEFANTKLSQSAAAYVQLGTLGSIDKSVNHQLVQNVLNDLTPESRLASLHLAHAQLSPTLTFEEFLNTELPFIRLQHTFDVYDSKAMSISIGSFATASFATIMYNEFNRGLDNYLLIGKLKPSELTCYLEPTHFEAFAPANVVNGATVYKVDTLDNGKLLIHDLHTDHSEVVGPLTVSYDLEEMAMDESADIDETAYPKKYKSKYKKRKVSVDKTTNKPKLTYEYEYEYKNRQISNKLAGDTNLKHYVGAQMSADMQHFVVNATQLNAPDYIDDIRKGKLTRSNILKDFTFGLINNDRTFKLINDSFYKNKDVHSITELNNLIEQSRDAWATAILLKAANLGDDILNLGPETMIQLQEVLFKDEKLLKLYNKLQNSYETSFAHFNQINIDNNYLRVLIMKHYDGTLESLRKCVTIARTVASYNHSGVGDTSTTAVSTDASIKGGRKQETVGTIGDTLSSSIAQDLDDIVDAPRQAKISALLENALHTIQDNSTKKGFDKNKAFAAYNEYKQKLENATDTQIDKAYFKLMSQELVAKQNEVTIEDVKDDDLSEIIKRSIKKDKANIVRAISHQINTIKRNLSTRESKIFLKDNSDIFNDDLTLKDDVLHETDESGTKVYKDFEILKSIKQRINQLSIDVRSGVYESKKSANYRKQLAKEVAKYKDLLNRKLRKPGKNMAVTIVEQDRSLTIDVNRTIPPKLQQLLEYGLSKQADSNIQYLSEKNEKHTVISLNKFIDDNIDVLSKLTEEEILDIVDFYLTSAPAYISDSARYSSLQVIILTYIYKSAMDGICKLDVDRLEKVYSRIKAIVNEAGTTLNTWQTAMKMFKPAETIIESMYKKHNIRIKPEQLSELAQAFKDGDPAKLAKVRQKIYEELCETNSRKYLRELRKKEKNALQKALGDDTNLTAAKASINSFFAKVWDVERMFMLSGPGTWIRNVITDIMIGGLYVKDRQILPGLNTISGKIGAFVQKMLPKKWMKESQYKIVGTKVSSQTAAFIKAQYIDTGLISMIGDTATKYDPRKVSKNKSVSEVYAELITNKLAQDVFNNNHKIAGMIMNLLSDDKYMIRTAISYFGKILTENNTDLSKGITTDVTEAFVDAYVLAANDFMHKTNFMHKIDNVILNRFGDTGYFVWKQFFPFAAASVNWYVAALRYTPIGLIKSIINYAKLEKTIEKMEDLRNKGDKIPSSKFAQYLAVRNIGKGVIGSIGVLIAGILVLTGAVALDDDDEKYKLRVGNVSVDISDVFGTQGILLGMSIFQGIKDNEQFDTILKRTCNIMTDDSLYTSIVNMFRYGSDNTYDNLKSYLTYNIPSMFVPSFLKTLTSIARQYDVQYSTGILGKLEKLAVNSIPFLDRAMEKKVDIYTGESQLAYNSWFLDSLLSKLGVIKFSTTNMSALEEEAILLGLNKSQLTGKYTVKGDEVNLTKSQVEKLNKFYAELNNAELQKFVNNQSTHRIQQKDGSYKSLKYSQMTDKEKATVFDRIMTNNSSVAKIYILTSTNKYKYYASDSEYSELRSLGIKSNIYRASKKYHGFVVK